MFCVSDNAYVQTLSILVGIVVVAYAYCQWCYGYWKRRGVPYVESNGLFGLLDNPFKSQRTSLTLKLTDNYMKFKSKGHRFCGFFFTIRPRLMLIDPDYIKCVMQSDFQHFTDRGSFINEKRNPLGAHLFNLGGSKWRFLRTKLTPTFTTGKIKMMFPIVVSCGSNITDAVQKAINKNQPADVKDILGKYTTDVIGSCAFGLECNSFLDPNSTFRNRTKSLLTSSGKWSQLKFMIIATSPDLARKLNLDFMKDDDRDFFQGIVRETVNYREVNKVIRNDFLQLLINLKDEKQENPLTMDEIAAQVLVFFIAGFETSSTTMSFCLYELALHPDIQERVRDELNKVGELTYESLNDLKYMGQAIDETLRKYPPVPILTRICVQDYTFPDNDLSLKKGNRITLPVYGLHYDPEYYPDPQKFDPDRFSPENKGKIHPFAYLPFGEGPRICIGLRFGVMQTKVGLALLLRKYRFSLNKQMTVPIAIDANSFTLNAKGGIWLDVEEIKK